MYWVFKGTVLRVLRIWFRPKVDGARNVPAGPAIIASNHLSFSDTFFLGAVVSRRLTFLAKSSYFNTPGVKGWLTARFFRGLGQVPIDRVGGTASETALDVGTEVLRLGGLLGIYPEGTRSPDGRLYRGHTG
jgi:1-acyl-sn-glycerol-3-phosphate acyltransferase